MKFAMLANTQVAFNALQEMPPGEFMTCMCMLYDMYAQHTGENAVEMAALVATCVKNVNDEEGAY